MRSDRKAAIVGLHEYPLRVAPGVSMMEIKSASIAGALDDAGLSWNDVDALYDANDGAGGGGLGLSGYLGMHPDVIDTTFVGGASYELHAAHAMRDIAVGRCKVAVLSYGSTAASAPRAPGGTRLSPGPTWETNMLAPYGVSLIANYAWAKQRHMYQYGTTDDQFAEIAVTARHHAVRNPDAVRAMTDLKFPDTGEIDVATVLESRMIADPMHLLECCMVSDGGGAVVLAAPEVARDCRTAPVWLIGAGEASEFLRHDGDITTSAAAQSGPRAFAEAGVRPDEIDIAMIYDSFTITVAICMEDLGFCKKGEIGDFVTGGRLTFDNPLRPALNTDGGGLSSNHPGMRGIFLLIEAARQLRGESTAQVPGAALALAHGNGGQLGTTHVGGTVIMAKD